MSTLNRATSDAVRRALKDRGITQDQAGTVLGLSQNALSRRLAGLVPWRLPELEELSDLLCIPLHELLQPRTEAVSR